MKRTMLIAASLFLLPAGATLAAPASGCPTATLLQQADDPLSCFKTVGVLQEPSASMRGAEGPVKEEMTRATAMQDHVPIEIRHSYGDPGWYGGR
ncbi:MAG: hypothetical protein HY778_17400 [Betaproteobacteria bacterium]|nr:hypothetical protein [Betaproteobacteria bacterium]